MLLLIGVFCVIGLPLVGGVVFGVVARSRIESGVTAGDSDDIAAHINDTVTPPPEPIVCDPGMAGFPECEPCMVGTASPLGEECTPCEEGTHAAEPGSIECTACEAGTYASGAGNSECMPCEAGTYNSGTGNAVCILCDETCATCDPITGECMTCDEGYAPQGQMCVHCCDPAYITMTYNVPCPGFTECITTSENNIVCYVGGMECGHFAYINGGSFYCPNHYTTINGMCQYEAGMCEMELTTEGCLHLEVTGSFTPVM